MAICATSYDISKLVPIITSGITVIAPVKSIALVVFSSLPTGILLLMMKVTMIPYNSTMMHSGTNRSITGRIDMELWSVNTHRL